MWHAGLAVALLTFALPSVPSRDVATSVSRESFVYLSPRPGARFVEPKSALLFRPTESLQGIEWREHVTVRGSVSGLHTGKWLATAEPHTVLFRPHETFARGETVTVGYLAAGGTREHHRFHVAARRVRDPALLRETLGLDRPLSRGDPPNPRGDPPRPVGYPDVEILVSDDPAPGSLFLNKHRLFDPDPYLLILDNRGRPEFFRRMPSIARDFKLQPNGLLTYHLNGTLRHYAMDHTYAVVDSFEAGNGYRADGHEFRMLPGGRFALQIYDPQLVDMSAIVDGGDPRAVVIGLVIQELDQNENVVFQWRSWDHFEITDATATDLTKPRIDYVHGNSIEYDPDGDILISCRHMDEITKIDRSTGEILWRFGGRNNEFTLVNDTQWFSRQHGVRQLANGNILFFDNGNLANPPESRAVEYRLDEENRTATLVWEYRHDPPIYGHSLGFAQRLSNGNTLIAWGSTSPTLTEVRPDKTKTLELSFGEELWSYRAFRFEWKGVAPRPEIWADTTGGSITLGFDKFGDDEVLQYYVYRSKWPGPTVRTDSTSSNSYTVRNLRAGVPLHFRVTALGPDGESPFSEEIVILPDSIDVRNDLVDPGNLRPNSPNPFRTSTLLRYDLAHDADVDLGIYNVLGQEVITLVRGRKPWGHREVAWSGLDRRGRRVPAGVYWVRLRAGDAVSSRKMVLLR